MYITGLLVALGCFDSLSLLACPYCQSIVKSKVYNQDFMANLLVLLLPVAVLLMIGIGIYFSDTVLAKFPFKRG